MQRRNFLHRAGILIASGTSAFRAGATTAQSQPEPRPAASDRSDVLVTSADSDLCRTVAERLSDTWRVRITGSARTDTPFPLTISEFRHDNSINALVAGVHTIVHLALPPSGVGGTQLIDYRTRQTYNLLHAAAEQGVRRVVYLSSLAILLGYDKRFMITEDFRPQPTPDAETLSHYLGEFTCREFARSGELEVVVLRSGRLDQNDGDSTSVGELPRTRIRDVSAAVAAVFGGGDDRKRPELGPWNVIHIHSETQSTRFPLTKAERMLRYRPQPMEVVP